MYPCGTLLFLSYLDRLRRESGARRIYSCKLPKDNVVEQVLQQVGILDILDRAPRLTTGEFAENVKHWRHASGVAVDSPQVGQFVSPLEGRLVESLRGDLYRGVTEAMTNSSQHAYLGSAINADLRRWWMFSQETGGKLSVAFCDLGIGIPASIMEPSEWDPGIVSKILAALGFAVASDSRLIRAALELHRTRTGQRHRGKGLMDIMKVVTEAKDGFLHIHSNRGMVKYTPKDGAFAAIDFRGSIHGTLILWEIPLPSIGNQLPLDLS